MALPGGFVAIVGEALEGLEGVGEDVTIGAVRLRMSWEAWGLVVACGRSRHGGRWRRFACARLGGA